jgi:hypothetical protein
MKGIGRAGSLEDHRISFMKGGSMSGDGKAGRTARVTSIGWVIISTAIATVAFFCLLLSPSTSPDVIFVDITIFQWFTHLTRAGVTMTTLSCTC